VKLRCSLLYQKDEAGQGSRPCPAFPASAGKKTTYKSISDQGDIMKNEVKCKDCVYFDLQDGFYSSNLRGCAADSRLHWKGDNAENCMDFAFREADRCAS